MYLTKSELSYDEMKRVIINVIKKGEFTQYADIENNIADYLLRESLVSETTTYRSGYSQNFKDISADDSNLIREIVWDLIIERVLTIGSNKANPNWPFLRISNAKRELLQDEIILHDVDGIISSIKGMITDIDQVIIYYLYECLNTYKIGALLASSVMLGCAAEKGIINLINAYTSWLEKNGESKEAQKFQQSSSKVIARRFDEFEKSFKAHKNNIPINLWDDFDIVVNSIFTIIRKNRNDAGHPTGNSISRDELSAWIHVFRTHLKKIYELKTFFEA